MGIELKLYEIFPTLDRDTVHAVHTHHGSDTSAAIIQLIELLGEDDEALDIAFALMHVEELDETAAQLAHDEQVALALQEELALNECPAGTNDGSASARTATASKDTAGNPARKPTLFSGDARQLLVRFGRQRARTNTQQRLLDPGSIDSAAIQTNSLSSSLDSDRDVPKQAETVPPSSLDYESQATGIRTGSGGREALYNDRLFRARASRRPFVTNSGDPPSIMSNA